MRAMIARRLGSSLWFIPALLVMAAVGLTALFGFLDGRVLKDVSWIRFPGGAESARSVLSTITSSMITFTGLVFSITMLVLQLASQQYSPRVMQTFLRDRLSQVSLGVFASTFTYALLVLRQITPEEVPGLSVAFAVVLVLVSLGFFVAYIDHVSQRIRISSILRSVREQGERMIAMRCGSGDEPSDSLLPLPVEVVPTTRSGVVVELDEGELVEEALRSGVVLTTVPRTGDPIVEGMPLFEVRGGRVREHERLVRRVQIGHTREGGQDLGAPIRHLVDVAVRALSPGVNDPSTAVQAINEIHVLLRAMATLPMPTGVHRDREGHVRLVVREPTWDDVIKLALVEIAYHGTNSVQVRRRMRALVLDLMSVVEDDRRGALRRLLDTLDHGERVVRDVGIVGVPDLQGLGA